MSEPIKVGDLVYVYWTHCPHESLGVPFVVETVHSPMPAICGVCKKSLGTGSLVEGDRYLALVSQVRKIPPLSELGDVEHKEEQPA